MPFSEADQRTVLLHLEVIRNIIRGVKPETTGDVVEVADGYAFRAEDLSPEAPARVRRCAADVLKAPNAMFETFQPEEPDLDGGVARQAAETASR